MIETYEKVIPKTYLMFDLRGEALEVNSIIDILNLLRETDPGFNSVVILNKNVARVLLEEGVVKPNGRGGYNRGDNYDVFFRELDEAYMKHLENKDHKEN